MTNMRLLTAVTVLVFSICFSAAGFATPSITIVSPQNTTYSSLDPIVINVTSNEVTDFYFRGRVGKPAVIARSATSFVSKIFGTRGSINFTVYANNSGGLTVKSVIYTINHSSIVNVTDCGLLSSSNTTYVLQNDISNPGGVCILMSAAEIILDMNYYTIDAETGIVANCISSSIKNGKLIGFTGILVPSASKCHMSNMTIESESTAIEASFFTNSLIENITITNASEAITFEDSTNLVMRRLKMRGTGAGSRRVC